MTGQQLKNSILQWAIQGKLVPQIESEDTAEDLLKEIRAEKEKLVKEGKLKKKDLEVKPIEDDEIPFEIPESWKWVRLWTLVSILGDGIHGTPQYVDNGEYFFVNGNNLNKGKIEIKDNTKRCSKEEFERYKKCLNNFSMLVSINGTIGNYAFYNNEPIFLGKSACYFNLMKEEFKKYMEHIIMSQYFLEYATESATGSTIKNVSLQSMKDFPVPLPPLSEQKRIVAKIEELMPLVEEYGKAQERLETLNRELPEKLKKSVLQEAIMGKLVPQDPKEGTAEELLAEIRKEKEKLVKEGKLKKKDLEVKPIEEDEVPFEIPEGWRWCRLGEICSLLSGQDLTPDRYFDTERGIPYITGASHFVNGNLVISRWTETPTTISHMGDLLITCKGTVGTMAYNNIGDIHIARQVMAISGKYIYLPYIQHFLEIEVPELEKKAHSIIPGISRDVVLKTIIPLPPLSEQKRIVTKLEEVMEEIEGMK